MDNGKPIRLKIPQQHLEQFEHFKLEREAAENWAQQLPVANTRAVATQLLAALRDLNHCKIPPTVRHDVLAALSGSLQVTLANLSKRFLHQPLVMPEEPRQLAELTDNLYGELTSAYSVLAVDIVRDPDSVRDANPARLLGEAIRCGLEFTGRSILLSFQLYRPVALGGWLTLHQLYALAERQGLATLPVTSSSGAATSITATYLQVLMLGCTKPNQLRQSDMLAVYTALAQWSADVEIGTQDNMKGLFLVDLDSDQPPLYSALYGSQGSSHLRHINTDALIEHLHQLVDKDNAQGKPGIKLSDGQTLPSNMLSHLIDSLGSMSMRNFNRVRSQMPLAISVGLGAAHFHAAGTRHFEHLLHGDDYIPSESERTGGNPFLQGDKSVHDPWRRANPEKDFVRESSANAAEAALSHSIDLDERSLRAITDEDAEDPPERSYPIYRVNTINASPGGYCLEWSGSLPEEVRAGAIASVREEQGSSWSIAVIRWVSRLENASTLIGLELLSPHAVAYGAMIHSKKGETSAPQRVLLLPEITLVGQPHTLITPRAGFRERQKISLLRNGESFFIQLTRQVAATASYAQFDFRYIKQLGEVLAEDKSGPLDASYDSLWSNI